MLEINLQQPQYFVNMNLFSCGPTNVIPLYLKLIQKVKYNRVFCKAMIGQVAVSS